MYLFRLWATIFNSHCHCHCQCSLANLPASAIRLAFWFVTTFQQVSSDCVQASRRSHAKPLLHQLHWLPVQQRITYKLAVLVIQSSEHVHSGLPTPPNRRTCLQLNFSFICHSAAGQTVHENRLL